MSLRRLAAVMAVAVLTATGCGGDDTEPTATSDDTTVEDGEATDDDAADADDPGDDGETGDSADLGNVDLPDFDDIDWGALGDLGFDVSRCLQLSTTAAAVASLPLAMFTGDEFDFDEADSQIEDLISDLPDEFHPELRFVHGLISEARDHSLTDPNNPIVRPEYSAAWDSYFEKLDAACDYSQ